MLDLTADLADGRVLAESLMLDTGQAKRPTGKAYNPSTQSDEPTYSSLFTSNCKIQARHLVAQTDEVGARTATSVRLELHLPVDTDALTAGDVFTVTTPGPLSTVEPGTTYRVTAPAEGSLKTARRYEIERVVS